MREVFASGKNGTVERFGSEVTARRLEDMSPTGQLEVHIQRDGDVIVTIMQTHDGSLEVIRDRTGHAEPILASVEFCTSGGRSPKTLHALRNLISAMQEDCEND